MAVRVGLGLAGLPFASAPDFWSWIDLLEETGVDSFWQTDRLVSRDATLESMSTMAALAGRTRRLKFGMSVTVVTFRDPLVLAKQCATIDWLSGGRLLPAFGVGPAVAPEWRATGRDPKGRGARADEALTLLSRLWSEERVDFEGEHFRYRGASIAPRPVQQPLPLWIGGSSRAAVRRTARLGTGWLAGIQTPAQVKPVVERIREAADAEGRAIDPEHYGAGFSFRFGSASEPIVEATAKALARFTPGLEPERYLAVGGADEIAARIGEYRAAGVSKFVLRPMAGDAAEVMTQTERLVSEVLPGIHGSRA
ncbi:MAG: LLM class flavin-dependent oxidoreductase [Myxococcota bacterium]